MYVLVKIVSDYVYVLVKIVSDYVYVLVKIVSDNVYVLVKIVSDNVYVLVKIISLCMYVTGRKTPNYLVYYLLAPALQTFFCSAGGTTAYNYLVSCLAVSG